MPKKYDLRYSRERAEKEFDDRYNTEVGPPPLYRADLLRAARERQQTNANEYRNLASTLNLSVNTIRDALAGNATKIETLWILARHFEIPWLQLFDTEKRLEFINGRPALRVAAKPIPGVKKSTGPAKHTRGR